MFHFTNGFKFIISRKLFQNIRTSNKTLMKALYAYFSIFFMESTALISRWLLRWNLLFCLDMMVNSNKILTWKWNSFKARLISWTKLKWRRLKMLLCGCMSRVGDCKASMSLIGWIPRYRIDIIFLWFSYFKKWDLIQWIISKFRPISRELDFTWTAQ